MRLEPVFDNIVLEPVEAELVRDSGIVLPGTANSVKPNEGIVRAVGPGKVPRGTYRLKPGISAETADLADDFEEIESDAPPVAVGDRVLYRAYTGAAVTIDGLPQLLVAFKDILAIVHEAKVSGTNHTLESLVVPA